VSESPIQFASEQRALQTRDPATAEEAFREIDIQLRSLADASEKANLILRKAVLLGILHRFDDARRQLDLALEEAPDDPDVRFQFDFIGGTLCDEEGKPSEAVARLTTVLSNFGERLAKPEGRFFYEDIQLRRGFDLACLSRFQEASLLLEESLSFELKSEDRSRVLSSLGLCCRELKDYERARHFLEESLTFDLKSEERSRAFSNLGLCCSELKDYERAKDYFLQALEIGLTKEWEGHVHFYLALSYAHLNLFREAKREFQLCEVRAAEYQLQIQNVYKWLSWVCKGLGERAEAEKYARLSRPS
jgi:tetratricopeptide (TPR) repeat protein